MPARYAPINTTASTVTDVKHQINLLPPLLLTRLPEDFAGVVEGFVVIFLDERFQHSKQGFIDPQTSQVMDDGLVTVIAMKDDDGGFV